MASIHFERISHRRRGEFDAVVELDLDVADGDIVAFTGGDGSGAATALRLLAGFEDPAVGTIRIGDRDLAGLAPRDRNVALVLPHHSLYLDQTAADHLRFPLVVSGVAASLREQRVQDVAERLDLGGLLDRCAAELSPAERQRVALGRAIVRRPDVLLMDEPFSGLAGTARLAVRDEVTRRRDDLGITTVVVIADHDDARAIAHRTVEFGRGEAVVELPLRVPA